MKFYRAFLFCFILAGCARAPVSDNISSYDNSNRIALLEKAEKGDAQSQHELGNSYCCGENGFWDTKQAIHWWCLAAKQGHNEATAKLMQRSATCPAVQDVR